MICPDCNGEKRLKILPKIVKGQRLTDVKCLRCQCTGAVPDEQGEWSMIGECFRERMIECRVTLRAGAEMLGVSAMELSNARRGIIDPTTLAIRFEDAIAERNGIDRSDDSP